MENGNKNEANEVPMPKDALEVTIGNFGKWQCRICFLMALLKIPIAWFTLSIIFLAPPTQFWCETYTKMTESKWTKMTEVMPIKLEGMNEGFCEMLDMPDYPNRTIPCKFGFTYNNTIFTSTIISEWDLVCGYERLIDLTQITLMLGVLIGNIFFGILADKIGRKAVIITCILFQSLFGSFASFVPNYWLFILLRFFVAMSLGGTMVTSFVMCMEVVGGKWRTIMPILYQIPFGFGNSIMAGIAYMIRDWRYLHLNLSLLSGFYGVFYWCIPESPRWLLVVGKRNEAINVLQKAAIENNIKRNKFQTGLTQLSNVNSKKKNYTSCLAIFSTEELRKRSYLLCFNWLLYGVTFYAFSQYLGQVGTNIFLTVSTSGFVALPGTIACIILVEKCGRRWTIMAANLLVAISLLTIIVVPKGTYNFDWPRVTLSAICIVGLSITMPALYLFTGELYPTILRNAGVGVSIMCSRLGSMLAPLIISLEEKGSFVPLIILAMVAFAQSVLVLPLPETKDSKLPETIEDLCKITDINAECYQMYEVVSTKADAEDDRK
ncbi:unnamed protein product [Phyllotreta striolata]|uniref:Major facilitator superfamily (MFS) profile domain-containing protein n=1 Tax=Phyllotreta striolata TaxID=444603 RepID=A0A9P0DP23_PHYSR|nr:unnamed protein product [Phyllotreta striolata]